jgi:RNA polymerase sigma-70 factor, ECF subfamily
LAVVGEIGSRIRVRVGAMPRDPARMIDSAAFLKALRGGPPAAERAFRDLDLHLRAPQLRFFGRRFPEAGMAEDLVQETLLSVHASLPAFAGDSRFTDWVYSLAKERMEAVFPEKYGPGHGNEDPCARVREVSAADPGPEDAVHKSLLAAMIRSAADLIPERYRAVWSLCDGDGMSGEEAAEALGIAHALVRVRLHRARGLIADRLRKERPGLFRKSAGPGPRPILTSRGRPASPLPEIPRTAWAVGSKAFPS